ncbi:MAG: phosphatidylglycerol lysyltransferase domain-containing protein [bacterium]
MTCEKIDLKHRDLLSPLLKKMDTRIAEYSFANLYLFRNKHNYEVITDKFIFIKGKSYDGKTYLMPTVDLKEISVEYVSDILKDVDFIFPVDEKWLKFFPSERFVFDYDDGDTDYLYDIEKMRTFAGKKLHGKRNLLHQFLRSYSCEPAPLYGPDRIKEAIEILEKWQEDTGQAKEETDFNACLEALKLYDELVICGFIYYVDKGPAGFIIGEEIGGDTFALHFAKGVVQYKGIYQFMFNNFSKILPEKYRFVNFEQDLGIENLRLSKMSYEPDIFLKKYRVRM